MIIVYTDGACSGNPGPGGWAWAVAPDGVPNDSGGEPIDDEPADGAARRARGAAGVRAERRDGRIVSDSTYVVKCFRRQVVGALGAERLAQLQASSRSPTPTCGSRSSSSSGPATSSGAGSRGTAATVSTISSTAWPWRPSGAERAASSRRVTRSVWPTDVTIALRIATLGGRDQVGGASPRGRGRRRRDHSRVLTSREVAAAPGDANEIVAVVVDGVGNGHGRGLSQWGSYGWAVNYGWDWTQILDHYYGGTTIGDAPNSRITVRLLALDDQPDGRDLRHRDGELGRRPGNYGALVDPRGRQRVPGGSRSGATRRRRARPLTTWSSPAGRYLGEASGAVAGAPAVEFTTPAGDDPNAAAGDLLGVCGAGGVVDHYRGSIYAANGTVGENRTVNRVLIESYLRGVVPRESPASWGLAGGGAGANALRAQSVAARSYALTQGRYSYAHTCDSSACQVYGGAGWRVSASSTERDVARARADRRRDRGDGRQGPAAGRRRPIVSTEFSASNGPADRGWFVPRRRRPRRCGAGQPAAPLDPRHRRPRPGRAGSTSAP